MKEKETVAPPIKGNFFLSVRSFFTSAIQYISKKFPFDEEILEHAKFVILRIEQAVTSVMLNTLSKDTMIYLLLISVTIYLMSLWSISC